MSNLKDFIIEQENKKLKSLITINNDFLYVNFNNSGIVTTSIGEQDYINAIALQNDNKIIAGGANYISGVSNFTLVRYTTSGALDPTFNGNGITKTLSGRRKRKPP